MQRDKGRNSPIILWSFYFCSTALMCLSIEIKQGINFSWDTESLSLFLSMFEEDSIFMYGHTNKNFQPPPVRAAESAKKT
jgi:hypothetical protein